MTASTRPRVAIVAASLDILGGQGVQAQALIEALTQDGYPVTFVPINPRFPAALRPLRAVPYLRTVVNQALYLPSLKALTTADTVHVFAASYLSFLLGPASALSIAKALKKRVVLHYHSGEADDHLANWGRLVHPWLQSADEIVVPSDYLAGIFAGHGYRTQVIRNVVDLSRFRYRRRYHLGPRFLSTRNFERHYRVDVVLRAFALIRAQIPNATLTVAGYGSEGARLRGLAGDGVRFVGKVAPASMPDICDAADVFLNASVVDNQPVSILEAFAAGLPVISTPTGDIPAMVRHNHTGLLVPPENPEALAAAALQMLTDRQHALAMAHRAHGEVRRYTWPSVRHQWAAVYDAGAAPQSPHHALTRPSEAWTSPSAH